MNMKVIEVETASGVYKVKKPVGRIGAVHMSIMMKVNMPKGEPEDWGEQQVQAYLESTSKVFLEWAEKVLPHIYVDGPFKPEEMPGEDQFVIFLSLAQEVQMPQSLFQSSP